MLGRWSWREIAGVPAPSEPTESKVQMRRRPHRDYEREQASMLAKHHRQNGGGQSQEEETQESPWMSSLRGKVRCGAEPLAALQRNMWLRGSNLRPRVHTGKMRRSYRCGLDSK
ncbi:unnamed protein product [Durusdinium trenchii]|uniref:Uncharacterized protein n=1 Tax=Durusdinium trenchii TaxID=1381693 RepID=A0ABP0QUS4_9DINO